VLIFEDDAVFDQDRILDQITEALEFLKDLEWDIFYFGSCGLQCSMKTPKASESICKIKITYCNHAYMISGSASLKKIADFINLRTFRLPID
jgi:hypothetical protein